MNDILSNELRVLAIDPSSRGVGYAVLEGPQRLIDWGVKQIGADKNSDSLKIIEALIDWYRPKVLVLEDVAAEDSRRGERIEELFGEIRPLARQKCVRVRSLSPESLHLAFRPRKDVIAAALAGWFPELQPRLPSPRECGDSGQAAVSVSDAAAFAMAFFYFRKRRGWRSSGQRSKRRCGDSDRR